VSICLPCQADEVLIINICSKAVSLNIAYCCFECFRDFDAAPPEKIEIVAIPNSNFFRYYNLWISKQINQRLIRDDKIVLFQLAKMHQNVKFLANRIGIRMISDLHCFEYFFVSVVPHSFRITTNL
jgi:hypothetical protein